MVLMHESDYGDGMEGYLPVNVSEREGLSGQMVIPGELIFQGVEWVVRDERLADLVITY
jgi:hypothetical protein